jgi:hypothetical protein
MGPKANRTNQKKDQSGDHSDEDSSTMMDMMRSISAQLSGLTAKMNKIDVIESEVNT